MWPMKINTLKKLKKTPRSTIKGRLRQMWVRSRERAEALKRDDYTCQKCNRKQSKAKGKEFKVEVHHINGVNWDKIIEFIYKELLVEPKKLKTLCKDCHKEEQGK